MSVSLDLRVSTGQMKVKHSAYSFSLFHHDFHVNSACRVMRTFSFLSLSLCPLHRRHQKSLQEVDCGSQDAIRVYTVAPKTQTHTNDQQVLTWVPLKTFCWRGSEDRRQEEPANREDFLAQSSIIIKSVSFASSAGVTEKGGPSSNVKVLLEVISHDNATEGHSSSISEVPSSLLAASWLEVTEQINCATLCPEVGGCISPDLWCDGIVHCPSGLDEANCDHSQMHTIITSENEATLLSSSGRDTSNAGGVKSSVSNSSALSSTSILTLLLSLTASLILIVSLIAVAVYVIKSSDLRRRIRRAKAALDFNRNSSASASSAASYSSSHYSFNFPRLSGNTHTAAASAAASAAHHGDLKASAAVTLAGARQMALRQPTLSIHGSSTSGRSSGLHGHGNLISLDTCNSNGHRTNGGGKDLSPLVISSLNTSIDTTGTNSNNSSCSSSGGAGSHAAAGSSHLYHRPSTLFRSNASALYSCNAVTGASSPLIASAYPFNQNTCSRQADVAESFLPSEKEFDYRSFIMTPSFTSSSRTCSRTSSKGSSVSHAHAANKGKMKNVPRKHKTSVDDQDSSQLELLMQQSNGPLVPSNSALASCSQPSLTFRSSRIMTLGHPAGDRSRSNHQNSTGCRKSISPVHGPYAAFNLYEDICDLKMTSSSTDDQRINDCLTDPHLASLDHQLTSHFVHNSCNDGHKLHESIDDDTRSERNDVGDIISVNDAMLEGPLGVNLHPAKISTHHAARRNVF